MLFVFVLLVSLAVPERRCAEGFVSSSLAAPSQQARGVGATTEEAKTDEVAELRALVGTLVARVEVLETEVAAVREARLEVLEQELIAIRRAKSAAKATSAAGDAMRHRFAARAAVGATAFKSFDRKKFEENRNDEFVDDVLEDLMDIGGDPTFLDQARDLPPTRDYAGGREEKNGAKKSTFVWDGVIDETAHFDEDF